MPASSASWPRLLVEIHGQHEHQALLSRSHQLSLLDAYAGNETAVAQVQRPGQPVARDRRPDPQAERWRRSRASASRYCATKWPSWRSGRCRQPRWPSWSPTHKRLANAGRLAEGAAGVVELLDGDSEFALRRALGRAQAELGRLAALDDRLQPLLELLDNATIQLGEAADDLGRYAQDVDLDPGALYPGGHPSGAPARAGPAPSPARGRAADQH